MVRAWFTETGERCWLRNGQWVGDGTYDWPGLMESLKNIWILAVEMGVDDE